MKKWFRCLLYVSLFVLLFEKLLKNYINEINNIFMFIYYLKIFVYYFIELGCWRIKADYNEKLDEDLTPLDMTVHQHTRTVEGIAC